MDKNKLESLLTEQALSGLSPEVEDLLESYLADHPEFQVMAESIHRTAELGQEAVSVPTPSDLPPFPGERILYAMQHSRWKQLGRRGFSIAASILIGIGIGLLFTHKQRAFEPIDLFAQPPVNTRGLDSARAFWSTQTYLERYQKNRTKQIESKPDTTLQKRIQNLKKGGYL